MENLSTENQNGGSTPPTDPKSIGERLAAVVKRGRGRPPGSGKGKSPVATVAKSVSQSQPENTREECTYFVESALFLFEGADEFCKRAFIARLKIYVKDANRVREFETEVLSKNGLNDKDRERLRFLLTQLALKYAILRRIGPEVGLLVFVAQYGTRQLQTLRAIESLKQPAKPVTSTPPPTSTNNAA